VIFLSPTRKEVIVLKKNTALIALTLLVASISFTAIIPYQAKAQSWSITVRAWAWLPSESYCMEGAKIYYSTDEGQTWNILYTDKTLTGTSGTLKLKVNWQNDIHYYGTTRVFFRGYEDYQTKEWLTYNNVITLDTSEWDDKTIVAIFSYHNLEIVAVDWKHGYEIHTKMNVEGLEYTTPCKVRVNPPKTNTYIKAGRYEVQIANPTISAGNFHIHGVNDWYAFRGTDMVEYYWDSEVCGVSTFDQTRMKYVDTRRYIRFTAEYLIDAIGASDIGFNHTLKWNHGEWFVNWGCVITIDDMYTYMSIAEMGRAIGYDKGDGIHHPASVKLKTYSAGSETYQVAWIETRYKNPQNHIRVLLHTTGVLEVKKIQNGNDYFKAWIQTNYSPFDWHSYDLIPYRDEAGNERLKVYIDGNLVVDANLNGPEGNADWQDNLLLIQAHQSVVYVEHARYESSSY